MQERRILSEYNETKKMLNKLRILNEIAVVNNEIGSEQPQQQQTQDNTSRQDATATQDPKSDFLVVNDVEVKLNSVDQTDLEITEDQKSAISNLIDNFKQQVSQIVDFDPGMTINQNQIRLDGSLDDLDVNFVFIAGQDSGVYVNAEMLKLELQVGQILEKLVKFEETFKTAMEPLIQNRNNN
jgi:hypothetical protein